MQKSRNEFYKDMAKRVERDARTTAKEFDCPDSISYTIVPLNVTFYPKEFIPELGDNEFEAYLIANAYPHLKLLAEYFGDSDKLIIEFQGGIRRWKQTRFEGEEGRKYGD